MFKTILSGIFVLYIFVFPCYGNGIHNPFELSPQMLKKVEKLAEKNKCEPVHMGFKREYVKEYVAGDKGDSIVFWCEKHDSNALDVGPKRVQKNYYLMFVFNDEPQDLAHCPKKIDRYGMEYIEVYKPESIYEFSKVNSLSEFVYLNNPNKKGPNQGLKHNGILLSEEDSYEIIYCHEGNWLKRKIGIEFKE